MSLWVTIASIRITARVIVDFSHEVSSIPWLSIRFHAKEDMLDTSNPPKKRMPRIIKHNLARSFVFI